MKNWKLELTAGRKSLAEVNIQGGIYARIYFTVFESRLQSERHQRKKWTREDNKNIIICYIKSNHTQIGFK